MSDEVKKFARKGIDAGAVDSLTEEDGVRVRLNVIDEVIEIAMKGKKLAGPPYGKSWPISKISSRAIAPPILWR